MDKKIKIALAGNPNVGKSTVFNAITGMKQHTGNWSGKTVDVACCDIKYKNRDISIADLPGCYSLYSGGDDETCACDFLCCEDYDAVIVVCDSTIPERNLILALEIAETCEKTVIAFNMMDEAKRKGIKVNTELLSELLSVPCVACSANKGEGVFELLDTVIALVDKNTPSPHDSIFPDDVNAFIEKIESELSSIKSSRLAAIRFIHGGKIKDCELNHNQDRFYNLPEISEQITKIYVTRAENIASEAVTYIGNDSLKERDRKIDKILTGRFTGTAIMIAVLAVILLITISLANYPSQLLSKLFDFILEKLRWCLESISAPEFLIGMITDGMLRTLFWVVSVMLPPMAIFFPMFTLLEDIGYLPRIAFNLDKYFSKAHVCGKQALTMCMGFGCNAVGVTGCRIIESSREKNIAMLTNNFVPCNGRFPTLISIITMFFIGSTAGLVGFISSSFMLTLIILLGIGMTFLISALLSKTVYKGAGSSFILELPPFRRPQFKQVIISSLLNRTVFVLLRAVVIAAPVGILIWLLTNINVNGESLLALASDFFDPFAKIFGLDGVILLAFILGFPANEIVVPIIIMAYMNLGAITDISDLSVLKTLLIDNGWTVTTAICTMLFSLMHWPCSTTCITIYKETRSIKTTLLAIIIPTVCGLLSCFAVSTVSSIIANF